VAWFTQRITETNMQNLLHKFTHSAHTITKDIKNHPPQLRATDLGGVAAKMNVRVEGGNLGAGALGQGRSSHLRRPISHILKQGQGRGGGGKRNGGECSLSSSGDCGSDSCVSCSSSCGIFYSVTLAFSANHRQSSGWGSVNRGKSRNAFFQHYRTSKERKAR
jgi:hypothetical protein